ncbi:MAG: zinc-binding alcohol dehydrogenase family protein [Lentisphaeria bacterium]|nr:zinc-binding alcohol dehydrogenase family protein [Lentisphaeria bacterium]NQZ66487.1 zinc-binding alcohol dehydrogenase family protein [Lentisphaeria bacterium]
MRQIRLNEPGDFQLTEIEDAERKPNELYLRVRKIGICGTDLHAFKGRQPFFTYPRVLGHELSAEVIESPNDDFQKGDIVSVLPYDSCGDCIACRRGKENCCQSLQVLGVHRDGCMQDYVSLPAKFLVKANGLNDDHLALIEPLAIAAHAVRRAKLETDDTILVIGAGPIGIGVVQFAKAAGCKVIVMDLNEGRLNFIKEKFGVYATVIAGDTAKDEIAELTNNDFPTTVFDATGSPKSMNSAVNYLAHSGTLVFVGLFIGEFSIDDIEFHKRESSILSTRNATRADFEFVIESLLSGAVSADAMITHRVSFDEMIANFEDWTNPEFGCIKAVVSLV